MERVLIMSLAQGTEARQYILIRDASTTQRRYHGSTLARLVTFPSTVFDEMQKTRLIHFCCYLSKPRRPFQSIECQRFFRAPEPKARHFTVLLGHMAVHVGVPWREVRTGCETAVAFSVWLCGRRGRGNRRRAQAVRTIRGCADTKRGGNLVSCRSA